MACALFLCLSKILHYGILFGITENVLGTFCRLVIEYSRVFFSENNDTKYE